MSTGGWETVVSKKGAKGTKTTGKGTKKPSMDSMPRIEPAAPVKESPTIYDAFLEEELKKERKFLEVDKDNGAKDGNKKNSTLFLKKKERNLPLRESLLATGLQEFETIYEKDKSLFPKNPDIWLKDLASVLNYNLGHIPDSDPICTGKPHGYPLCLVPDDIKGFFLKKLSNLDVSICGPVFDYCIDNLMDSISRDFSSLGYRIIIQLLLQSKPEIVLSNLIKYEGQIQKNAGRPLRSLCILWSVGQVGLPSLSSGIKIWCNLMFGFLHTKNLNNYVVSYLEKLFEIHPKLEQAYNVMTKTDYFKFFGEIYSELSNLPIELKNRLLHVYPKVKVLSWGNKNSNLNLFFSGYMSRLTNDCQKAKKTELLQCLMACLVHDIQSFAHWRKDYHKTFNQSSLLLQNIESSLNKEGINKKILFEMVTEFQMINEEFLAKSFIDQPDVQSCQKSCKAIIARLTKSNGHSYLIIGGLCLAILLLFGGYLMLHKNFNNSVMHQALLNTGALPVVTNVCKQSLFYLEIGFSWFSTKSTVLLENANHYLSPLFSLVQQLSSTIATYVLENTAKPRIWISSAINFTLEEVSSHLPFLLNCLNFGSKMLVQALEVVLTNLLNLTISIHSYVIENIFVGRLSPENIQETVELYMTSFYSGLHGLYYRMRPASD